MTSSANIAAHLPEMAAARPNQCAYSIRSRTSTVSRDFAYLDQRSNRIAHGLASIGLGPTMRVALMVPPGADFLAVTFALFKLGTVPVFIDPGLGIRGMGRCLAESEPTGFIGVPKAHLARIALGWAKSARIRVHTGFAPGCGYSLKRLEQLSADSSPVLADVSPDDMAAILFTSGSTGAAKGVVYTHAMFQEQVKTLREVFAIEPGEWDLCTFPLFALFAPALGLSSVVPNMNAARPAKASPRMLVDFIRGFNVSNLFGSPALINVLSRYGEQHGIQLGSLKRVISAGAPVSAKVIERMTKLLSPGVEVFTPYGATESLPVAVIGSNEILRETRHKTDQGAGICVGRPVGQIDVTIIPISDEPIADWSSVTPLPINETGEIAVQGRVVSRSYFNIPDATALAKIPDATTGTFWHRMGDVGYLDEQGRLWFCGRKSQRVITPYGVMFTIPCEGIFNQHGDVARTALVGVNARPVICVELVRGTRKSDRVRIKSELVAIGKHHRLTQSIQDLLVHPGFPVDVRHNAKINRERLAIWAARQLS